MRHVKFRDKSGYVRQGDWTDDCISVVGKEYDPECVDIIPPTTPTKIIGVGQNYPPVDDSVPEYPETPRLFFKPPHTIASHKSTVELPLDSNEIVYEAEVGVVIGKHCKNVAKEDVSSVIQGYTCVNDLTERTDPIEDPYGIRKKAFDNAAPIGPVIVSPDQFPGDANIQLFQNGELKQDGLYSDKIYSEGEIIEKITEFISLEPGDIVITGSPAGIGPVNDGDHIKIKIEGIGTLEHDIVMSK
ncbi:fumarylacetoacetate hydrolase family protein [Halorubraceae archaeon YAN]|nr:fumarylacetoacetate hydrolase family protein [Halorubraceae archaeon YAN]